MEQMALLTRLEYWANQLEIIISAYIGRKHFLDVRNGITCEMFDYKGYTCHLPVSNIVGMTVQYLYTTTERSYTCHLPVSNIVDMTVQYLFTTTERSYTPVGRLMRVKAGDTTV